MLHELISFIMLFLEEGSDDDEDKCESKNDKDDEKMKCYGAGWGIGSSVLVSILWMAFDSHKVH